MDIFTGIVFVVIFYFVFSFIWRNTKTISFSGFSGFFSSWLSQITCAAVISWIATAIIVGGISDVGSSLSDIDFFDILVVGVVIFFIYLAFTEDLFDRKTFRKNYNSKVTELFVNAPTMSLLSESDIYKPSVNANDLALNLPEDFISTGNSKLISFPGFSIKNIINNKINRMRFSFDFVKSGEISASEEAFSEIVITAMIESVAAGKSKEIESALNLIDIYETFKLPPSDYSCI